MCNTITCVAPEGIRPFDWVMPVVEILVLLLIAYEIGTGLWSKRRTQRYPSDLYSRMRTGQELQARVPTMGMGNAPAQLAIYANWSKDVRDWADKTNESLLKYSAQAAASFLFKPSGDSADRVDAYRGIAHQVRAEYLLLMDCLNNLRAIMEKPDVYQ